MSLCSRDPAARDAYRTAFLTDVIDASRCITSGTGRNVAESPAASPALASVPLPVAACVLSGWLAQAVE
ncbi:hypothetical protein [Candidatus Poriferisodalis sp.]|uniref:hypothetical protein n=1 Tax=Candidatus Poriferisodalis sp. TaxID=3101277 RepID=UPI003B018A2B